MPRFRKRTLPLSVLAILPLAACETPLPAKIDTIANAVPVVENSTKSPCWQQRQIAVQRTWLAAIKGRRVTYRAPCDIDPKPKVPPASTETPKTS